MALPSWVEQNLLPSVLRVHDAVYRNTNGWIGHRTLGIPSLLLHTVGAKTGTARTASLTYARDGGDYLIVASKGGAPQHPGWYRNILANPEVDVQVGTSKMTARARTATGEERARLWEKALEFWPPYADYQRKTEREIPVVVLDPVR